MTALRPPADLFFPSEAAPPLRGLLPDLARSLGVSLPDLPSAGLPVPASRRTVVFLVDGMGWHAITARLGHAPNLRRLIAEQPPGWGGVAAAGYPSTTAASLTSFATGQPPGQTGMLGYTVRDPRSTSGKPSLVNLVSWTGEPGLPAPDPHTWQPQRTVFSMLGTRAATSIGRSRFAGSGLTQAALRGSVFVGVDRLESAVEEALRALRRPGLVYLYWGELDHLGHGAGWTSAPWGEHLGEVDAAIGTLLRRLPRDASLLVTADHGMVDVTRRIDVAADPVLSAQVDLVAGEPRALHVHTAPGARADVLLRWQDRLGEDAWVLTGEQAIDGGLFGPVTEHARALVGDLVVAARGTTAIHDSRTQTPASLGLIGMHGSLTPDELLVPALVASAS